MAWRPRFCNCLLTLLICTFLAVKARDVHAQKENYLPNYTIYHNVTSIRETVVRLVKDHPTVFSFHQIFHSRQKLPIHVLRLKTTDRDISTASKPERALRLLLVAGEHAREFIPVESVLYLLHLLANSPYSEMSELLRNHFDLFVIPMLNPDGRRHIEETSNFCWRGTSTGVDIGRNFPWEFGGGGSSSTTSDEEYRGSVPFSEPESRVIQRLSDSIKFDGFLSLHSGIRHIYIPFSDSKSPKTGRRPAHWKVLDAVAKEMTAAMKNDRGHTFVAGPAHKLNNYPADGTMFDYMAGVRHVPVSMAVELWGHADQHGSACFDLFNPQSRKLQHEVEHLMPLYLSFFKAMWTYRKNITDKLPNDSRLSTASSETPYPLVALVACFVVVLVVVGKRRLCSGNNTQCRVFSPGRKRIISLRSFSQRFSFTSLKSV